jgi:ketosteroid isomerase-like protein
MEALRAAGRGDSAYVMGNYKCTGRDQDGGKIYTGVVVNGIAIPEQFAIYANHQPGACANARFHWE